MTSRHSDIPEKRITSSERAALLRFAAAMSVLEETEADARFRMVKYGPRDLGLARAATKRLWEAVVYTIPQDQLRQLLQHIRHARLTIGISQTSSVLHDRTYGQFLSYEAINAIALACQDHCMMCQADKHKAKQCDLRKALDEMNLTKIEDATVCPYMGL